MSVQLGAGLSATEEMEDLEVSNLSTLVNDDRFGAQNELHTYLEVS